jgi:hypothetical protein
MERRSPFLQQILALIVLILGTSIAAALVKFADLPTRMSVVEVKQQSLGDRLTSMDSKLDLILGKIAQ